MSDDAGGRWGWIAGACLFAVITVFIVADIYTDSRNGSPPARLVLESLVFLTAIAGFGFALLRIRRLRAALLAAREDARRWQAENRALVQGLSTAIRHEFTAWGLSEAEAQIGFLLLKGLSLQSIADLRNTSERTVREQARAVYRKSGLSGRNELAAYFLEDILPPIEAGSGEPTI